MNSLVEMNKKNKVLKQKLDVAMNLKDQINEEILLVESRNFSINQRLVKVVEDKDATYVDYFSQLINAEFSSTIPQINNIMDAMLKPFLRKINQLSNVSRSGATLQLGGEGAER